MLNDLPDLKHILADELGDERNDPRLFDGNDLPYALLAQKAIVVPRAQAERDVALRSRKLGALKNLALSVVDPIWNIERMRPTAPRSNL